MERMIFCFLCGAAAGATAEPRNPLCSACEPNRPVLARHVVRMNSGLGSHSRLRPYTADCACGWSLDRAGPGETPDEAAAIREHWHAALGAAAWGVTS